jgi:hypothetical protein
MAIVGEAVGRDMGRGYRLMEELCMMLDTGGLERMLEM